MTRLAPKAAGEANGAATPGSVALSGLVARAGDLEPGEALIDRVFATVRAALDQAGLGPEDYDSVVIAADDVSDGRSITTMLHATAAGAYRKDEVRVTHGALTALGVATLRVAAGASERSLVVSWSLPSIDSADLGRTSISPRDGSRALVPPERLEFEPVAGACAACLVGEPAGGGGLRLDGFCFGQAAYDSWLARDGEPAGMLRRLGENLALRAEPFGPGDLLATSLSPDPDDWRPALDPLGMADATRVDPPAAHHGIADGLVVLGRLAEALQPGGRGVALATGLPQFMLGEGAAVRRTDA